MVSNDGGWTMQGRPSEESVSRGLVHIRHKELMIAPPRQLLVAMVSRLRKMGRQRRRAALLSAQRRVDEMYSKLIEETATEEEAGKLATALVVVFAEKVTAGKAEIPPSSPRNVDAYVADLNEKMNSNQVPCI